MSNFKSTSRPGLHNSLHFNKLNNTDLLVAGRMLSQFWLPSLRRNVLRSCKSKKQQLPLYLLLKHLTVVFFLTLIKRKNLSLLFHSSFIRVVTVIGYFLETVIFSRPGKIKTNYRNVGYTLQAMTVCLQYIQIS